MFSAQKTLQVKLHFDGTHLCKQASLSHQCHTNTLAAMRRNGSQQIAWLFRSNTRHVVGSFVRVASCSYSMDGVATGPRSSPGQTSNSSESALQIQTAQMMKNVKCLQMLPLCASGEVSSFANLASQPRLQSFISLLRPSKVAPEKDVCCCCMGRD